MALVSLVDHDRQWFKSEIGFDGELETSRDVSFCAHMMADSKVLVVPDALLDERFADNPNVLGGPQVRFYGGYPLHASNGQPLGALCVMDHVPREFSSAELAMLGDLATLVENELQRQQLTETELRLRRELSDAERRASIDTLTRLWNRGHVLKLLHAEHERIQRDGGSLQAAMLDIDHFKKINDTHGHLVGDAVLREVSRRLRACVRPYDILGRYGGEEFLLIMNGSSAQTALAVAERIRSAISAEPAQIETGALALTISIGLGSRTAGSLGSVEDLLDEADQALYRAKESGRNRVVVSEAAVWQS
jgi:diguanylate cyclase (GGDEF)-like protein